MAARSLVLGTHNEKKKRELRILLEPVGIKLRTLKDFPAAIEVEETGDTFQANAQLKATSRLASSTSGSWGRTVVSWLRR